MDNKRITFKERTSAEKGIFIAQIIVGIVAIVLAILNVTNVLNFPYDIVTLFVAAYFLLEGIFQLKHNPSSARVNFISGALIAILSILFIVGVFNF